MIRVGPGLIAQDGKCRFLVNKKVHAYIAQEIRYQSWIGDKTERRSDRGFMEGTGQDIREHNRKAKERTGKDSSRMEAGSKE